MLYINKIKLKIKHISIFLLPLVNMDVPKFLSFIITVLRLISVYL